MQSTALSGATELRPAGRAASRLQPAPASRPVGRRSVQVAALFTKKKAAAVEEKAQPAGRRGRSAKTSQQPEAPKRKENFLSSVVSALDFSEARSEQDARALYEAKYGERKKGQRLTPEQERALKRKIGGTTKDFFKEWVDVEGKYVDSGYVSSEASTVPALPFLVAVVLGLFATVGYVVSQTS